MRHKNYVLQHIFTTFVMFFPNSINDFSLINISSTTIMASPAKFSTKIGIIAATIGSAIGLGNVWRFPAETQANGGAAFLIVYVACVLVLGVPVMVAEFAIGRRGNSDAIGSIRNITGKKKPYWLIGVLAVIVPYIILCYYMVVSGWTFSYLVHSIDGALYTPNAGDAGVDFTEKMRHYVLSDYSPLIMTFIVIALNYGVLMFGVRKGIERLSNFAMPVLFVILFVFCIYVLTLPGAGSGVKYFLSPDFTKVTPTTFINALSQAFFSLSLGMGILVTYAAYYPKETKLARTASTVSVLDMFVAIMMGLIIFPAIGAFGDLDNSEIAGSTLIFVTLPEIFNQMPSPCLWSTLFFILLNIATLTSTVSIAEVAIASVQHRFKIGRKVSTLIVIAPLLVFSSICSLSLGRWSGFTIFGMTIFDAFDYFATNIMLPIVAFLMCVYIAWIAPRNILNDEITNNGTLRSRFYRIVIFIIRYIAPFMIALIFVGNFIK